MIPSSSELQYFLEVANTLNFSRAAERLGISQPSLSLAIQRLENTIGTQVFIRHKTGVSFTQPGKQLLFHARKLIEYWNETKTKAISSKDEVEGYFSIGCHSTIAMHMLSKSFPLLLQKYPKLELHLKHDLSRKMTESVVNLSVDIGIVVNPIKHPDLIMHKICTDEFTFWKGEGNAEIQNIENENAAILCDPNLMQTQELLKRARKLGVTSKRIITLNSLEVVAHFTANGCGIGILPKRVAHWMYPDHLERLKNFPVYTDEIYIVYRRESRHTQAIKTIVSLIRDNIVLI